MLNLYALTYVDHERKYAINKILFPVISVKLKQISQFVHVCIYFDILPSFCGWLITGAVFYQMGCKLQVLDVDIAEKNATRVS